MKPTPSSYILLSFVLSISFFLTGCSETNKPKRDAEQMSPMIEKMKSTVKSAIDARDLPQMEWRQLATKVLVTEQHIVLATAEERPAVLESIKGKIDLADYNKTLKATLSSEEFIQLEQIRDKYQYGDLVRAK
jgi:hypothetical protein